MRPEDLSRERVLVTGDSGFLGRHVVRMLLEAGAVVTGLSRTEVEGAGYRSLRGDVTKQEAVRRAMEESRPTVVIHLAALVTGRLRRELVSPMARVNVLGTVNLLGAAAQAEVGRFVAVDTVESPRDDEEIPLSPYGASKAAVQPFIRLFQEAYSLPTVVLRPSLAFGPGQQSDKLIPYVVLSLLRGEDPEITSGERVCDFVYVDDVVRGIVAASFAPAAAGTRIELGSGTGCTIRKVVELITARVGGDARPRFGEVQDRTGAPERVADLSEARRLLEWEPLITMETGIDATIDWYRQHEVE